MKRKFRHLKEIIRRKKRLMIAFSGGVDSTFLVAVARKVLGKESVIAVTAASPTYPTAEYRRAVSAAKKLGVRHRVIQTDELKNPRFKRNTPNRCFHCKDALYRALHRIAMKEKMVLCDGTNASDSLDVRPGEAAAQKWGVTSPLKMSRLTKDEIRTLSRSMTLPTWNEPAQACLASRIPFGNMIHVRDLKNIETAEAIIRRLGFPVVRVRHHGDIARIEIEKKKIKNFLLEKNYRFIVSNLKKLGWKYLTIDMEGYRMGSLN